LKKSTAPTNSEAVRGKEEGKGNPSASLSDSKEEKRKKKKGRSTQGRFKRELENKVGKG